MRIQPGVVLAIERRLLQANHAAGAVVRDLSRRYHVKPEDRIGRDIHIRLVHAMLGMLTELDR